MIFNNNGYLKINLAELCASMISIERKILWKPHFHYSLKLNYFNYEIFSFNYIYIFDPSRKW